MSAWFGKSAIHLLATEAERAKILAPLPSFYRDIDIAFHAYLTLLAKKPTASDTFLERKLKHQQISDHLAEECIVFSPLAWGRPIIAELGIRYSEQYRLHSLISNHEQEFALDNEPVFVWATLMISLYRTEQRNELFKRVSMRSAEINAINKAIKAGHRLEDLIGSQFQAPLAYLHRGLLIA